MKVLRNGKLVEEEISISTPDKETVTNEPVDRSKVTVETKKDLLKLLKKLPEIRPILDILLGKKEVEKLRELK